MEVNNLPQINEPFIMRPGLRLDEVYKREKEIERITDDLGFGPKSKEKQAEEDIDKANHQAVNLNVDDDSTTATRVIDDESMRLF